MWLPPGQQPIRGKAAIRTWLEGSRDRIVDIRLDYVILEGGDAGAYRMANFTTTYVASGSSEAATIAGWHLWMLRRENDSEWRVTAVAWSIASS